MSTESKNLIIQSALLSVFVLGLGVIGFSKESSPLFLKPQYRQELPLLKASRVLPLALYPKKIESGVFLKDDAPPSLIKTSLFAVTTGERRENIEPIEYVVKEGDTLEGIARKFQISVETILGANEISNPELIRPGMVLTILPTDGVLYLIEEGETLEEIAEKFGVSSSELVEWNPQAEFLPGEVVFVPGVKIASYRPNLKLKAVAKSFFICPLPGGCTLTQGLHPYNAVDISHGRCGDPVLAAASGKVQKTGYSRIGGNYVLLSHGNGVYTFYGHLSRILVRKGENVLQGEVIGYVGNTGYTIGPTGCHVHFEVRGAKNPFAY